MPDTSDDGGGGGNDATVSGNDGSTGGDGSTTNDSGPGGACDLSKAFGTPVAVAGLGVVNSVVRLSDDERIAYFSLRSLVDAGEYHIFQATRSDRTAPFGSPAPLTELNSAFGEAIPAISSDGKKIIYVYGYNDDAGPAKARDIYGATRTALDASFSTPFKIMTGNVNSDEAQDDYPSLEANDTLWFVSTRYDLDASPEAGKHEIVVSTTSGGLSYTDTELAPNINAKGTDQYYPVLTHDRLRIYYARGAQLYTATRATTADSFSDVSPVPEINDFVGTGSARPGWVSTDGCRLYFTTGNPQTAYVASKPN